MRRFCFLLVALLCLNQTTGIASEDFSISASFNISSKIFERDLIASSRSPVV